MCLVFVRPVFEWSRYSPVLLKPIKNLVRQPLVPIFVRFSNGCPSCLKHSETGQICLVFYGGAKIDHFLHKIKYFFI
jgi:hypothetical protein